MTSHPPVIVPSHPVVGHVKNEALDYKEFYLTSRAGIVTYNVQVIRDFFVRQARVRNKEVEAAINSLIELIEDISSIDH